LEASKPIEKIARKYIDYQIQMKEKCVIPLTLHGYSNGARIAFNILNNLIDPDLENRLKSKHLRLSITFISVSGLLNGTKSWHFRIINQVALLKWIFQHILKIDPQVFVEFQYNHKHYEKLKERARQIRHSEHISLKYEFYASRDDEMITPCSSSLPILGKNEKHVILKRQGHLSIFNTIMSDVLDSSRRWIEAERKSWDSRF
jgi:hypothetical protein